MTPLEQQVADLVASTTELTRQVVVSKTSLDGAVTSANTAKTEAKTAQAAAAQKADAAALSATAAASSKDATAADAIAVAADRITVATNKTNAATDRAAAAASELAAAQSAALAGQNKDAAANSVTAALLGTNAPAWVSGTTYKKGDVRYSTVDRRVYSRTTDGAGTVDPSADGTNWYPLTLDADTGLPTVAPTLSARFDLGLIPSAFTCVRDTETMRVNKRGDYEVLPPKMPCLTYDSVTREPKGLLCSSMQMNGITTTEMTGGVVGVIGSGGVPPNNWRISSNPAAGMTSEILAFGVEDGIKYMDVRMKFTAPLKDRNFSFGFNELGMSYDMANQQDVTLSAFIRMVGGSYANLDQAILVIRNSDSSSVNLNEYAILECSQKFNEKSLKTARSSLTAPKGYFKSTATVKLIPYFQFRTTGTGDVDITLRIGLPTFEFSPWPTMPVRAINSVSVRGQDTPMIRGKNFTDDMRFNANQGTVIIEFESGVLGGCAQSVSIGVFSINDESSRVFNGYSLSVCWAGPVDRLRFGTRLGQELCEASFQLPTKFELGKKYKVACSYSGSALSISVNGGAAVSVPNPHFSKMTFNRLTLGEQLTGGYNVPLDGPVKSFFYHPKEFSPTEMQIASTL